MRDRFFWRGMFLDNQNFCRRCEVCLRNKRSYERKEPLKPIKLPYNFPRALIAMDIAYLPWTSQGYRYVLIIVDLFSKYMEAIPMKNQEATTIAEALRYGWFHRYGFPLALLSDQCPNVDGTIIREICAEYGIQKLHSSAYHPEGDGEAERTIQTFKQCMRCLLEERGITSTDWPKLTQEITFICNSQVNASTRCTPQEIMYGERLRRKIDAIIPSTEHACFEDPVSYCEAATPRNLELQERVAKNIEVAQDKMKTAYDKKTKPSNIQSGDWVLVRDETRSSALAPLYLGPWLVVERLGVNLNLIDPNSERKKIAHLNRCKISPRNRELTESNVQIRHSDAELFRKELGKDGTEQDGDCSVLDTETVSDGPRRSTRNRKEPDRYGDFEGYW